MNPNPNPIPHISSDERRTKSKRNRGMRKGREKKPTRTGPWPAREKKGRTGAAARRARQRGHRGQAARRRRAPPPRSTAFARSRRSLGCAWLRRESEVERGESGEEEREGQGVNGARVAGGPSGAGFLTGRNARSAVRLESMAPIDRAGFQPRRVRAPGRIPGPGPGCGLGVGERAGRACGLWAMGRFQAETVKSKSQFSFFLFLEN